MGAHVPTVLLCPCGNGRPVVKLNAKRHSFDRSLWCPKCGLTAREAPSEGRRVGLWNAEVRRQIVVAKKARAMIPCGDTPVAGYYTTTLISGGPRVAVRIWWGHAIIDGEEQDRDCDWRVEIDGETDRIETHDVGGYRCRVPLDPMTVWPHCAASEIDHREYLFLLRRREWARNYAPDHPAANPRQRIDTRKLPPQF